MDDDVAGSTDLEGASRQQDGLAASYAAGGVVARPRLFERLAGPARLMVVSAPPGSGKTVLLRSWINDTGIAERTAWVTAGHDERDSQTLTERLLSDLAPLGERRWLVLDDVHELSPEALRRLESLIRRAPPELRFVLATRHDMRLGLHQLRLEGELAEIREHDLRFTLEEAGELFAAAGAGLPERAVAVLHERTEGWAAGLRLAALALAGHPDPEGFAAEFSGSERTVAEYLLAEVLDRQDERARRLLLRTSVLERVNGELADLLTGEVGGERVLQDLERAGGFVVSLDSSRSWFRYHRLFADLLRLESRRTAPGEVVGLHLAASGWFAEHGYPVEAVRHAQSAGDWALAARLLAGYWPALHLDGRAAAMRELLAGFPPGANVVDAELAIAAGAHELSYGSLEAAERYMGLAERGMPSVSGARRRDARLRLDVARLLLACQRADQPAEAEAERRLRAEVQDAVGCSQAKDLSALVMTRLGGPSSTRRHRAWS